MSPGSYEGKCAVIVGCFSGMGEATARELVKLGAEVHGADIRPSPVDLASFHHVDLRDKGSIDSALEQIGGPIDVLFNCSGLPQTFPPVDVLKVNFVGLRHWTENALPMMNKGGAICSISSVAGMDFATRLPTIKELIAISDFDAAVKWVDEHIADLGDPYNFSKEVLTTWTMMMGTRFIKNDVRINCICPGVTQTPMMPEFEKVAAAQASIEFFDIYTHVIGRRARPEEQAYPMLFLNSDAASYINGQTLYVDGGFVGGVRSGEIDHAAMVTKVIADAQAQR